MKAKFMLCKGRTLVYIINIICRIRFCATSIWSQSILKMFQEPWAHWRKVAARDVILWV